jgi:GT2 family glycosyltransferase
MLRIYRRRASPQNVVMWPGTGRRKKMPGVACIVLHYEVESLTRTILGDLLAQDYDEEYLGLFVTDNGSSTPFQTDVKGVTVLRSDTNRFIAGGHNFGIEQLKGDKRWDYFWIIDNDVRILNNDALLLMVNEMVVHPRIAAIQPAMPSDHAFLRPHKGTGWSSVPFIEWTAPLLRYTAVRDLGLADERMRFWGMDLDWCARARRAGWDLAVEYGARCHHEYRGTWARRPELNPLWEPRVAETETVLREKYGIDWFLELWPQQADHWYKWQQEHGIR